MDEKTKKWLKQRVDIVSREIKKTGLTNINKLADNFKFDKRKIEHFDECPCYDKNVFCHDGKSYEKYCLLCSCLNYNTNSIEGGCNIENPFGVGYYFDRSVYDLNDIWDCSDCLYPHTKKETLNALKLIKNKIDEGNKLNNILLDLFSGKMGEQASSEV